MTSVYAVSSPTNLSDNGYVTDQTNYLDSSPLCRWVFQTSATKVWMKVWDNIFGVFPDWAQIGIYVNGAYYGTLATTAINENVLESALPAGNKNVELVSSLQSNQAGTLRGDFFRVVYFSGGITTAAPVTIGSMVVYGDSIAVGSNCVTPASEAWTMLVRQSHPLIVEAWGYRSLNRDGATAGARTTFAAQLATYNPSTIWMAIGLNDYILEAWSAADFGTAYADLLDKLHTAIPAATIYCQTMIDKTSEVANALGDTLGAYRTQITTASNARPTYCVTVDGTAFLTTDDLDVDGTHPTVAGHALIAGAVNAELI